MLDLNYLNSYIVKYGPNCNDNCIAINAQGTCLGDEQAVIAAGEALSILFLEVTMTSQELSQIKDSELAPIHILADLLKTDRTVQSNVHASKIANELVKRLSGLEDKLSKIS